MAYDVASNANTVADALRDNLNKAERMIVSLSAGNVEEFLCLLDTIEAQFDAMGQDSGDLRPESGRWESILRRLGNQPTPLIVAANRAGGLAKLRAAHPPAESFWWELDRVRRGRQLRQLRRLALTVVALVTLVGGALWAINTFFPPDPAAVYLVGAQSDIEKLVMEQRWEDALEVAQTGLEELPDSPELAVWVVVLLERLGRTEDAAAALDTARTIINNDENLWILMGNSRLQTTDFDGARAAGETVLKIAPESAQGYFLLANVADVSGDRRAAMDYLDKTFLLAEEDNPQLAVIAKVRLGQLLQMPDAFLPSTDTFTETITATGVLTGTGTVNPDSAPTPAP